MQALLHSQSHHSTSSHCVVQHFSNCPHVLGRAEVGESLNRLSRSIRSTVLLAVPTHMALFFILDACSGEEGRGMDEERVTEGDRGKTEGWDDREREERWYETKNDSEKRETEIENQSGKK